MEESDKKIILRYPKPATVNAGVVQVYWGGTHTKPGARCRSISYAVGVANH